MRADGGASSAAGVGLDHLADCFKRPAASNPADPDDLDPKKTVPPREKNRSSPSARATPRGSSRPRASRPPTTTPALLAFLRGVGADAVAHTGAGAFDAHLLGVRRVMQAWAPTTPRLADAALSRQLVYGTEGFQGFALPMDRRGDVRALIGERAEFLVWVFCVVDRLSVDNDPDAAAGAL